jgi:Recombination, repair and ssDNA binding protein UvsY
MIIVEDIIKEWESDCQLDSLALDDSTLKFAKIHAKYLAHLTEFKLKLRTSESKLSELRHAKWLYYTGKMTQEEMDERKWPYDPFKGASKPLRSDLETYVDADPDLRVALDKKAYFQTGVDVLTEILDTLRWRHQHVRNVLDFRKFTAGC